MPFVSLANLLLSHLFCLFSCVLLMSLSRNYVASSVEGPGFPYAIVLERKDSIESLLFANSTITELTKEETDSLKFQRGFTVEKLCDAYTCLGVFSLAEGQDWLVLVTGFSLVGKFSLAEIFKITSVNLISLQEKQRNDPDYLSEVRKFLSSGFFYFCPPSVGGYDITRSIQRQTVSQTVYPSPFLDPLSRSFFWNRNFWLPFLLSGVSATSDWLVRVMCGGVEMRTVYVGSNAVRIMIISRLSCERAGTRFSCRGCNDIGHVANFVETEQVIIKDEAELSSFVQIRGSVPLLWEQAGHNLGKHFVRLSRGFEACAPAFERHFSRLINQYNQLTVVNLLAAAGRKSNKLICEGDESSLNAWYQEHHRSSALLQNTEHIAFDFHAEWKRTQEKCLVKLWERLAPALTKNGFFHYADGLVRSEQNGVIRTNCIDCLDRTNCVQSMIAIQVLEWQIAALHLNESSKSNRAHFVDTLKQMWTQNGDHCSRIYAGTGAMLGGKGKYADVATSASRAVQSGILDSGKHSAIHMILKSGCPTGELGDRALAYIQEYTPYTPIWLCRELILRYPLFTNTRPLRIFVGSWNVNGGQRTRSIAYKEDSIDDWLVDFVSVAQRDRPELLDPGKDYSQPIDIYAIGFQEIVDLNAQNIVSADTKNQEDWAQRLIKTISRSPENQYIYLTSIQLVGVCLIVFIRPQLAPFLRDVAIGSVKTGLGGATGNKGGVAVRFRLHGSSVCFVCGHLAAGQNKVSDRNSDLAEIANRLSFPQGRTVWSHDYVFLFGDFNYRIGQLGNQMVRDLVAAKQYRELSNYEQLRLECFKAHEALEKFSKETGGDADQLPTWQRVLSTFNEGNIDFAPTYKYDIFSNDYDTSEKNRVPAWTDRILWTRRPLYVDASLAAKEQATWNSGRLLLYNRAEVRTSDHRPVYALFDIDIFQIDEKRMKQTFGDFVKDIGPLDGTVVISPASHCEAANSDDIRMIVGSCGSISVMRYVNSKAVVTFSDPHEAGDALKLSTNTMFKFEPKFLNASWFEAVSKVIASNLDDYSVISNNKLLSEPAYASSLLRGESPYPVDEYENQQSEETLHGVDSSASLADSNEPSFDPMMLLSVTESRLHPSKSAENLRARTPPPPRPPPPPTKKPGVSPSPSQQLNGNSLEFIIPVPVSRPAVVETPVVVKEKPFVPKFSQFVKLTSVGLIASPALLDNSLFGSAAEDDPSAAAKVPSSHSIDDMLSIADEGASDGNLLGDADLGDAGIMMAARSLPPSRPPPPAPSAAKSNQPSLIDDFEQATSHSKFYLSDADSKSSIPTSWPDESPAPVPRRAPPPVPVFTEEKLRAVNDPWEITNLGNAVSEPILPSTAQVNSWPEDPFPAPHVPQRAPPPAPKLEPNVLSSDTVSEPVAPSTAHTWPDDPFNVPHVPQRAPQQPSPPPPPPAPRRMPPVPPSDSTDSVAPAPPPPPRRAPAAAAPPPPPPRRQ